MAKITRYIFRPFLVTTTLVVTLLATLTVYDSCIGDQPCPEFIPASYGIPQLANENLSLSITTESPHTHEQYWEALRPTLRILDEVNPEVAGWVRMKHRKRKIHFSSGNGDLARFDLYTGELVLGGLFFVDCERNKAAWVCHEYRHSRQNFAKVARYILSFVFQGKGNPEIVENDAYLYEQQARSALHGDNF